VKTILLVIALLGPMESLDRSVQAWVQEHTRPELDRPARFLTGVGRPWILASTLAGIALLDRVAGPATAGRALLVLIPTNLVVEGLKRLTFRARPDGEHKRSNASFPSSHAANAVALAAVFARRWKRWAVPFYVFAALVAASRMVLNRHYLSDVVVGAAIGLAADWLVNRWLATRSARAAQAQSE